MPDSDCEFFTLDLYQEGIEPLDTDTQAKMFAGKDKAYQHACQWTTYHPNSSTDLFTDLS